MNFAKDLPHPYHSSPYVNKCCTSLSNKVDTIRIEIAVFPTCNPQRVHDEYCYNPKARSSLIKKTEGNLYSCMI